MGQGPATQRGSHKSTWEGRLQVPLAPGWTTVWEEAWAWEGMGKGLGRRVGERRAGKACRRSLLVGRARAVAAGFAWPGGRGPSRHLLSHKELGPQRYL